MLRHFACCNKFLRYLYAKKRSDPRTQFCFRLSPLFSTDSPLRLRLVMEARERKMVEKYHSHQKTDFGGEQTGGGGRSGRGLVAAATYFGLICITLSLLVLPVMLPPLPPPPLMLLLLPIAILALLVLLAFMPSNAARDMTHTYA